MQASPRRNYLIASSLYFVLLALYMLPSLYLFLPEPIGPAQHANAPFGQLFGPILLTILLMLAVFGGLGWGIRTGQTWAKIIYALLLAYGIYVFVRALPFFLERSAWSMTKESVALALMLGVAFFLFRDNLTRRSTTAGADVTGKTS